MFSKVMSKASDGVRKVRCSGAIPARARSRESSTQFPQAVDVGYLSPKQHWKTISRLDILTFVEFLH